MITSLDYLVILFLGLAVLSVLSIVMMFAVKNTVVRKVFFYIAAAIGLYTAYAGFITTWPMFANQSYLAIIFGACAIIAVILERTSKYNEKRFSLARVLVTLAVVVGMINSFML